ncbi:DUF3427 domain-containing protein [Streptomyces sp. N2-109]|uniref:DUF3427 domain-containing protein n=1 Tax=Streptomyces gossypii TaxID=2883101 RepID=A0ABT2JNZ6_9ACTN|nr:DEAD/DEAH box helicase [Streptomyces gossypii]MCT2589546.1 DUF3427 domain-containing protein [Streptomyces gossypii]
MTDALYADNPATGLYEQLITQRLQERINELKQQGWKVSEEDVSEADSTTLLAGHISEIIRQHLATMTKVEQVLAANLILESLASAEGAKQWIDLVAGREPRQVLALSNPDTDETFGIRPSTPLSESALLTNAPDDPSLGTELRYELASADRVDLLCAFVKWHGLRTLQASLEAAHKRDVPMRVITTTYMGATERRALDRLVREYGAEVKINYEIHTTRLHAKAWLFRRNTGYDTAYVGSSNLSKSALLDGLEWNVRLSSVATPAAMVKFDSTFESYWANPAFESYDPDRDAERLDEALHRAGWMPNASTPNGILTSHEVRPFPHQQGMLERLWVERKDGADRNLLVAATGTGKTVMAALDFQQLRKEHGDLSLLFVAHRREILTQSRDTYRAVLKERNFGELHIGGHVPKKRQHVFASIQSLQSQIPDGLSADHFDVIVIDEFHHATANTYKEIIKHFKPKHLLGLTATPERADGYRVQDEYFGGHIAAEMRLWEALTNELVSPFQYFGIADETDMTGVHWKRGGYDRAELENVIDENQTRAELIIDALRDKILDPKSMHALGFCVSIRHAHFMADFFCKKGIRAKALDGSSLDSERQAALDALRRGDIQILFAVDLFNEGLDIPDIDTLLFLRPTSSVTLFLQQLGRGLRRTPNKAVLTVLDFVGQHRKEYRFEDRFRAITNHGRTRLAKDIEDDFSHLPSGYEIILDKVSKERILENVHAHLKLNVLGLAAEVRGYGLDNLLDYLKESGRDIDEIYRNNYSWTTLLRRAKLLDPPEPPGEKSLLKRVSVFLRVDDYARLTAYEQLLEDDAPGYDDLSPTDQKFARMLYFSIWPYGTGGSTYQEGLKTLHPQEKFRKEVRDVLKYSKRQVDHLPVELPEAHASIPLVLHASYSREEILTALDEVELGGYLPGHFNSGVRWSNKHRIDALLINVEKSEKDFKPSTRYKDYAISPRRFHWESQGRTPEHSATGTRYQTHQSDGSHVFLFVRRSNTNDVGNTQPYTFLGPVNYVSHEGSKPMGITWELDYELPDDVWTYSKIPIS